MNIAQKTQLLPTIWGQWDYGIPNWGLLLKWEGKMGKRNVVKVLSYHHHSNMNGLEQVIIMKQGSLEGQGSPVPFYYFM